MQHCCIGGPTIDCLCMCARPLHMYMCIPNYWLITIVTNPTSPCSCAFYHVIPTSVLNFCCFSYLLPSTLVWGGNQACYLKHMGRTHLYTVDLSRMWSNYIAVWIVAHCLPWLAMQVMSDKTRKIPSDWSLWGIGGREWNTDKRRASEIGKKNL